MLDEIKAIFVNGESVHLFPDNSGRVYLNDNSELTMAELDRLSQVAGTKDINIRYYTETEEYSDLTPAEPSRCWVEWRVGSTPARAQTMNYTPKEMNYTQKDVDEIQSDHREQLFRQRQEIHAQFGAKLQEKDRLIEKLRHDLNMATDKEYAYNYERGLFG